MIYRKIRLGFQEEEPKVGAWLVIEPDGTQWWFLDGLLHRLDGPAKIRKNEKVWYWRGQRHCSSGPAVILGARNCYFLDGKQKTYEEWLEEKEEWASLEMIEEIKGQVI